MLPDSIAPLSDETAGCTLETRPRSVQNGSKVYWVSLNREWLNHLGLQEQGAGTMHSLALRPVEVTKPAIIIQPAAVVQDE